MWGVPFQGPATAAAAVAAPPQPVDPPPARAAMASSAFSVRQQADNVSHVIQFDSLRKKVCKGIRHKALERELVVLHLDDLYVLALKPAVMALEPESADKIATMKRWVVSGSARPAHMAQVDDSTLLDFIAMELMEQDVRLKEDLVVDARFAAFLTQNNNAVKKSLAATKVLNGGVDKVPAQPPRWVPAQPPRWERPLECPKCHFEHKLRDCPSPVATLSRDGSRNFNWREEHHRGDRPPEGGRGGGFPPGYPRGGQPVILPP